MFKYWTLKKYAKKLLPTLEKEYGAQAFYTPSQIRKVVYCKDFAPEYLPLAYILYAEPQSVKHIINTEFPTLNIARYKSEMNSYLEQKSYRDYFQVMQKVINR